jgi:hypothetical protein
MKLIANRQLTGEYGTVVGGQIFEVRDEVGTQLMADGVARSATAPRIEYDTKVIVPAEAPGVSARQEPFRHVPVLDEEPAPVATNGDPVLSESDVPEPRASDPGRRRGRSGSSSG